MGDFVFKAARHVLQEIWESQVGEVEATAERDLAVDMLTEMAESEKTSRRLQMAESWVEKVRQLDVEEMANGAVVRFTKAYRHPSKVYLYVAVKVDGLWFVSNNRGALTDLEFQQFLVRQSGWDNWQILADCMVTSEESADAGRPWIDEEVKAVR